MSVSCYLSFCVCIYIVFSLFSNCAFRIIIVKTTLPGSSLNAMYGEVYGESYLCHLFSFLCPNYYCVLLFS